MSWDHFKTKFKTKVIPSTLALCELFFRYGCTQSKAALFIVSGNHCIETTGNWEVCRLTDYLSRYTFLTSFCAIWMTCWRHACLTDEKKTHQQSVWRAVKSKKKQYGCVLSANPSPNGWTRQPNNCKRHWKKHFLSLLSSPSNICLHFVLICSCV